MQGSEMKKTARAEIPRVAEVPILLYDLYIYEYGRQFREESKYWILEIE